MMRLQYNPLLILQVSQAARESLCQPATDTSARLHQSTPSDCIFYDHTADHRKLQTPQLFPI